MKLVPLISAYVYYYIVLLREISAVDNPIALEKISNNNLNSKPISDNSVTPPKNKNNISIKLNRKNFLNKFKSLDPNFHVPNNKISLNGTVKIKGQGKKIKSEDKKGSEKIKIKTSFKVPKDQQPNLALNLKVKTKSKAGNAEVAAKVSSHQNLVNSKRVGQNQFDFVDSDFYSKYLLKPQLTNFENTSPVPPRFMEFMNKRN